MHEVEDRIRAWRELMLARGIRAPEPLDELEAHLREAIEDRVSEGYTQEEAVLAAQKQLGCPEVLGGEFRKIRKGITMKKLMMVVAGIAGVLVGFGLVMPAVAQSQQGAMTAASVTLLVVGLICVTGGGVLTLRAVKKSRA